MKNQIKRCALILPIVFMLLMSCVSFSSALADEVDYRDYLLDSDGIEDFDTYFSADYFKQLVSSIYTNINFSNSSYFLSVDKIMANYNSSRPYDYNFNIHLFFVNDTTPYAENADYVVYNNYYQADFIYKSDHTFGGGGLNGGFYFVYNKITGQAARVNSSQVSAYVDAHGQVGWYTGFNYIYFQGTDIPDFPLADGVNQASSGLKVDVHFLPTLSGQVDRMMTDANGISSYASAMRMTITNKCSFPIQYKMYIMKKNQTTHRSYTASGGDMSAVKADHNQIYDDDPVFVYYSNEWVYSTNIDNSSDWYNGLPQKQNKGTEWHYVTAGNSIAVMFNYSQINLKEMEEYICYVEAVRCDYDCASRMFVSHATSEAAYPEMKQIFLDDKEIVFQSEFQMLHYSDVHYDPNDTSNGVLPYSTYGDGSNYAFSYNAKENELGQVDYNSKNVYKDPDSWYSTSYDTSSINIPSYAYTGGASGISSLSSYLSGFFSLINYTLGFFPASVKTVFSLGIIAVVVVAFFKAVFRT